MYLRETMQCLLDDNHFLITLLDDDDDDDNIEPTGFYHAYEIS